MKISLIASPDGALLMTWENIKRNKYPVVVASFGNIDAHINLATELTLLYNNQQELIASAPDHVVAMPQREVKKDVDGNT